MPLRYRLEPGAFPGACDICHQLLTGTDCKVCARQKLLRENAKAARERALAAFQAQRKAPAPTPSASAAPSLQQKLETQRKRKALAKKAREAGVCEFFMLGRCKAGEECPRGKHFTIPSL